MKSNTSALTHGLVRIINQVGQFFQADGCMKINFYLQLHDTKCFIFDVSDLLQVINWSDFDDVAKVVFWKHFL